ncbi:NADH-quinone oxidoreductase subunit C [uncultured Adlercreutzia sp.]|uniref:NADH-quinone oxidoreductase subunit C n=1 Tax=uncultured Adlercreutzia sp. TaxID=875803 RepID=UPI0026F3E2D4|nr:NADH-quinone oxidoreductase subunit C [uncultured Adlercreutzia sp.]
MDMFKQTFDALPLGRVHDLAAEVKDQGWRYVQILAVNTEDGVDLVYSYMKDGHLANFTVKGVKGGDVVPSITDLYLEAFVCENEIHDLFDVAIEGIAIDFGGMFYQLAEKAPMTIVSPEKLAAQEKARKVAAAKAAKEAKAAAAAKEAVPVEAAAPAPAPMPEPAPVAVPVEETPAAPAAAPEPAAVAVAVEAQPEPAAVAPAVETPAAAPAAAPALSEAEKQERIANLDAEKAAKVRAALLAKAKKAAAEKMQAKAAAAAEATAAASQPAAAPAPEPPAAPVAVPAPEPPATPEPAPAPEPPATPEPVREHHGSSIGSRPTAAPTAVGLTEEEIQEKIAGLEPEKAMKVRMALLAKAKKAAASADSEKGE